jgi:cytochrome c553
MGFMRVRFILSVLLLALAVAGGPAFAQSVSNGQSLYNSVCISCHSMPPAGGAEKGANSPSVISNAINLPPRNPPPGVAAMQFLQGLYTASDLADIAAYIGSVQSGAPPPPPVPAFNYTDMWWGGDSESGWGFNVIQHASNNIFGVMYTYDANGKRTWFLIPGGTWTAANIFTGTWYRSSGPPYNAPFKPNQVIAVGNATLVFQNATQATLTFSVDGVVTTKTMSRLQF